jgi:hypothetical protein
VKRLSYRTASLFGGLAVGIFLAVAACSNQGEGERCQTANGSDDCRSGEDLVCTPFTDLTNTTSDRCCPRDRSTATNPVCKIAINPVGTDASAPADTGPPPSTTADATTPLDATPE